MAEHIALALLVAVGLALAGLVALAGLAGRRAGQSSRPGMDGQWTRWPAARTEAQVYAEGAARRRQREEGRHAK